MLESIIQAHVQAITQDLDSRRFRGEDPPIPLGPDDPPEVVIAKTLAAQALHAVIAAGDERFNPDEPSAQKRLAAGIGLLDYWSFRDARRLFDDAARRAREPALQQQITLYRLLADYLKEIVTADPDRTLPLAVKSSAAEPLARMDRLSPAERDHFAGEIERLWELRASLKDEPFLRTVWLLVQARISMDSSESAQGLTWLLAAAHLNRDRLEPTPYLQSLLDRARRRTLRLIGMESEEAPSPVAGESPLTPDPSPAGGEGSPQPKRSEGGTPLPVGEGKGEGSPPDDRVRAWDLYEAVSVALDAAYGESVRTAARAFRIKRFFDDASGAGEDGDA